MTTNVVKQELSERVAAAAQAVWDAEDALDAAVYAARDEGASWALIAGATHRSYPGALARWRDRTAPRTNGRPKQGERRQAQLDRLAGRGYIGPLVPAPRPAI